MPRLSNQEIINRNNVPVAKQNPFLHLRPKQIRFFMEWLKNGGNGTEAYIQAYKYHKSREKAGYYANELLRNHPEIKETLYEMWGFSEKDILKTLNEAKNATRQEIYKNQVYESPDHYARMKAIELAKKLAAGGVEKSEKDKATQVNILVVNDPNSGTFRVEDRT